jgi:putative transposase
VARHSPLGATERMVHTHTNLLIHGLFSTKERRPVLDTELRPELFPYTGGIIAHLKGRPLLINGPKDHVPLLKKHRIEYDPRYLAE